MTDLIDQLAAHKTLGTAPREELAWLAEHGTVRHLTAGEVLSPKDAYVDAMYIVLNGYIAITVDRGAGRQKLIEWRTGDVAGALPYSRIGKPPGDSVALEPSTVLAIKRDDFTAMVRACDTVTSTLVHKMLDRARHFTSGDLRDETMMSLGRLSAGLAHELNNPVSAIARGAALLEDRLEDAELATRSLGASRLTDAQLAAIDTARAACMAARNGDVLSPLAQAEREEAIMGWLADHRLDERLAGPLGETAVTLDALDTLAAAVTGLQLDAVLRWAASGCVVRGLASEIRDAAMRISGLVDAVKGFTHMDQASVAEPVDLARSLSNTIAVLNSKARKKSVAVSVALDPDLPAVQGFWGELNQIWANLIDNALDAVPEAGRVQVRAGREHQRVVVRIVDNGAGIPDDIRVRIFDPFFTTKPPGQGTGLGLDIVRRLAHHNEAEIGVESHPGRTEFSVSLPIAEGATAGASS